MHLAARAAGEAQIAEVHDRNIALLEIAPEAERRHVANADDRIERRPRNHPLARRDQRKIGIFAQAGERLGVGWRVE
jgi:hypothetical protein